VLVWQSFRRETRQQSACEISKEGAFARPLRLFTARCPLPNPLTFERESGWATSFVPVTAVQSNRLALQLKSSASPDILL
jgi:hypothetical protein